MTRPATSTLIDQLCQHLALARMHDAELAIIHNPTASEVRMYPPDVTARWVRDYAHHAGLAADTLDRICDQACAAFGERVLRRLEKVSEREGVMAGC